MEILNREALAIYPNGQIPQDFAYKFKDGDGRDHNGKPFADREGYAGHIILNCTTQIPLKCFLFQGGNNILVNDGIKNGDYVNVQLNIVGHPPKGRGKPGVYLNPSAIQLIQSGKEIINAPSGDQVFGQTAPTYAGQMVVDQAPQMPGGMGQAPQQQYAPQGAPQQGFNQAPAPMPGQQQYAPQQPQQADPHYGVLPQQHQPAPGQGFQSPPANYPGQQGAPQQGYAPMPGQQQYR